MTTLPRDNDNTPIPALRLKPSGAHNISVLTVNPTQNANPFDSETRILSLYATSPVYVAFGDSNITATSSDHYFPSGLYYDVAIGGDKTVHTPYVSLLAVDSDCSVFISEKQ
jgi:hypothetical protein